MPRRKGHRATCSHLISARAVYTCYIMHCRSEEILFCEMRGTVCLAGLAPGSEENRCH